MFLRSGKKAELCVRAPRKQRTVNKASDRRSSRPEGLKPTSWCPERTETMEKWAESHVPHCRGLGWSDGGSAVNNQSCVGTGKSCLRTCVAAVSSAMTTAAHGSPFFLFFKKETIFYRLGFLLMMNSKPQGQSFGRIFIYLLIQNSGLVLLIFEHGLIRCGAWKEWHF